MGNKRRPQGEGMVRKREDGRWEGRIVIGHKKDGTVSGKIREYPHNHFLSYPEMNSLSYDSALSYASRFFVPFFLF